MVNSYRIIPVYTGDVSGAASALYELGGLTVIHDPSGCNSTYNTHDETRWYDEDSLIYISGLSELDAILGNDENLIQNIVYAAEAMHPQFIALASSPIPFLNGTDFQGIAKVVEHRTGLPTFFVPTNGTHDYTIGAGEAFLALAKHLFSGKTKKAPTSVEGRKKINILGLTPLDYDAPGILESLGAKLSDYEILSQWACGSSLEELKRADEADLNLVVSETGLKTAQWMQEHLGVPYVLGCPVGAYADVLMHPERPAPETEEGDIMIVGEPVMAVSLKEHLKMRYGLKACVIDPLETTCPGVFAQTRGEEDLEALLQDAAWVIADPLYKPLVPQGAGFIPFSHEAFSGRCFRGQRVNVLDDQVLEEWLKPLTERETVQ